ncbi:helix-turn-helix domain-containing protein [Agarilytica rhodophyticola]|uniref:helix-turn-helix domain-containing protein n=1 Tax=Agarilytica rhodophyticola TaxID=1737490 RepID=UPI000B341080|nr:helix-turn-helix transcriptional regulator [Agarilytica rhodophyticola]
MKSKKGSVNDRDKHIARKVREARIQRGLSQKALAKQLGITYQQLYKYEHAQNRISASRLEALANALNMPVVDFYAPYKADTNQQNDASLKPHEQKLIQTLRTINNPTISKSLNKLLTACLKAQ